MNTMKAFMVATNKDRLIILSFLLPPVFLVLYSFHRNKAKAFSKEHKVILVIKGAHTITIFNHQLFINSTGNPGMATAGSGDVLTGVITGLISQGYQAVAAAIFGVYLHGKAGDFAAQEIGYEAIMASDIINYLGDTFVNLFKRPEQPKEEPSEEE